MCVVAGHYFLHSKFNNIPFVGPTMFLLGILQTLTAIGVPLFMMITGYLNCNKAISRNYFKGITRVLVSYLFFSLGMIAYRATYLGEEMSWFRWALKITDFSAIPYAWYIEMWIGLFLLTPFLNLLWKAIATKRHHRLLLAILFACSALPDLFNRYGVHLMPGYWTEAAYPLFFYFAGSYARMYSPKIRPLAAAALILALAVLNPAASLILRPGGEMLHIVGGPGGIVAGPIAIIVFVALYQSNVQSNSLRKSLTKISLLSLDMYLVSYLFDSFLYPKMHGMFQTPEQAVGMTIFAIVPVLLICDFAAAYSKEKLFSLAAFIRPHGKN